ncbi:AraC family transcriptional regulator [Cohnella algarum]|uniref:AraC family transcriptional regulator n=1 Tax=Cohnella algarum TaxID=2044859 RepID=UPI0019682782|nr:AraC family transcriptional regulator [Cohnella algarum]
MLETLYRPNSDGESERAAYSFGHDIGDIVLRVGYVDSTNFIRKFKKLEGITPIQYRTIVQTGPLPISK